jgi:type IV pilus assembly protein PilQ
MGGILSLVILLFCVLNVSADEIIKPAEKFDYSSIPPFASNIVKKERSRLDAEQKKDFEDVVRKVVRGNRKELDEKAEELANDPAKLQAFSSNLPAQLQKTLHGTNDNDHGSYVSRAVRGLLRSQYNDSKLKKKKISLSLKGGDIRDVIALIGKSAGINFIIDDDVNGKVPMLHLDDVSVAAALSIVLSNNRPKLAVVKEHDVWRIVRMVMAKEILIAQQEEEKEHDMRRAIVLLENTPWSETMKMQLEKMWLNIVGEMAQKPGFYFICDEQSKKVFFRGYGEYVTEYKRFLNEIDVNIPQIKIEARFVCAEKGFEEALGFQWSGVYNRRASVGRGWNVIGGGTLSDIKNSPAAQSSSSLIDWALNMLPSPDEIANNVKIPFVFGGSDLNTKRLNLVLNAAENRSEIKTLLKPSVLTNNKETAEILVGESIPIETIVEESVEGRLRNVTTAQYKDVGIQLKVRPIVAPDTKSVFIDIFIENSQEGTKAAGATYSPITTTRSKSRVLLKSGQTTLISGLIKNIDRDERTSMPGISKIPVLGWLFKGKRKKVDDKQLMIFITPTIVT